MCQVRKHCFDVDYYDILITLNLADQSKLGIKGVFESCQWTLLPDHMWWLKANFANKTRYRMAMGHLLIQVNMKLVGMRNFKLANQIPTMLNEKIWIPYCFRFDMFHPKVKLNVALQSSHQLLHFIRFSGVIIPHN
jgi:hypothetical protein